jgi:hypothetical protein
MDYTKIYNQIIERAQTRKLEEYVEKHHIVPKCIGGLDIKENMVELTAREHFICHKLLCVIYPNEPKLLYALWLMAIGKKRSKSIDPYVITSREYERIKIEFITRRKQVKVTQHHKNKVAQSNSIPVYQYDLQGNFLKKWNSAMDAQRYFSKKEYWKDLPDNIASAARGHQKTSHGYIWSYKKEKINLDVLNWKGKSVNQIDCFGNIIKKFPSSLQAMKELNICNFTFQKLINKDFNTIITTHNKKIKKIDKEGNIIKIYSSLSHTKEDNFNPKSINNVLNNKSKTSGGYRWEYIDDNEINYRLRWEIQK